MVQGCTAEQGGGGTEAEVSRAVQRDICYGQHNWLTL